MSHVRDSRTRWKCGAQEECSEGGRIWVQKKKKKKTRRDPRGRIDPIIAVSFLSSYIDGIVSLCYYFSVNKSSV